MSEDKDKMVEVGNAEEEMGSEEEQEMGGGGDHSGFVMQILPPEVKRRTNALRRNQYEITEVEANFYKEMHDLECKYAPLFKPLFEKRNLIVTGKYEPTDVECDLKDLGMDTAEGDDLAEQLGKVAVVESVEKNEERKPQVGIPEFWLSIFRNVELLSDMVHEHDIPILKHLLDIEVEMSKEPMGFKLHFHFSPNEYFTNTVLTKTYYMKSEVDKEDPFSYEGPEIVKCEGCPIDWAKGKNVTVKTIRKKQKHKQRGSIRTVSKTVENPSFFNFFNPPQFPEPNPENENEMDEETQLKVTNDFEVGQYIRERIVPRAYLYFTGEALEDEEDDEFEEEEEEAEEDDGDDDEGARPRKAQRKPQRVLGPDGKPQECKQQ